MGFKKRASNCLTALIIGGVMMASPTLQMVHATSNANYQYVEENNISNLIPVDISEESRLKINNDINNMKEFNLHNGYIYKIEIIENEDNIYHFKYPEGTIEQVTIKQEYNLDLKLNVTDGVLNNELVKSVNNMYFNGEKLEKAQVNSTIDVSNYETPESEEETRDGDSWVQSYSPYGSSSDYNISAGVISNPNVPLTTSLGNITISVLSGILSNALGFGILSGAVAGEVASQLKNALSPSTHGLSSKNFKYFHKEGSYISSKKMWITKNNIRWYSDFGYSGSSLVIPTYSCRVIY